MKRTLCALMLSLSLYSCDTPRIKSVNPTTEPVKVHVGNNHYLGFDTDKDGTIDEGFWYYSIGNGNYGVNELSALDDTAHWKYFKRRGFDKAAFESVNQREMTAAESTALNCVYRTLGRSH